MPERAKSISERLSEACETVEGAESVLSAVVKYLVSSTDRFTFLQRQEALDETQALGKVVEVQEMYLEHIGIQGICCGLWGALCFEESVRPSRLSVKDVVQVLILSFERHWDDLQVSKLSIGGLTNVGQLVEVRGSVFEQLKVVERVVERGGGGCHLARFIAQVSLKNERNKGNVVRYGGLEKLCKVSGKWTQSSRAVCLAIRNVCVGKDWGLYGGRAGLVEEVLERLRKHGIDGEVAKHGLAALYHLLEEEENVKRVRDVENWAEVLMQCGKWHEEDGCVITLLFGVGCRVGGEEELIRAGGVEVGVGAMRRFVTKRGVLYWGARFVRGLVEGGGVRELKEVGGVEVLLDVLYCSVVRPVGEVHEYCAGYAEVV